MENVTVFTFIPLYSITQTVSVMGTRWVFCVVGTGYLHIIYINGKPAANVSTQSCDNEKIGLAGPATKSNCKIWSFHISDCEKCRLLGYKYSVRTSQETHYVFATEYSLVMLCKIWGFRGGDYEECRLLGYKNPVCTSQETHYFSVTESSQLMLCKIWCFHGGDYEEFRLLGYKNVVRTSQETHYISTTESSRLMLCNIPSFPDSDYEECRLRGCDAVWLL
jgi:hypothetical protein